MPWPKEPVDWEPLLQKPWFDVVVCVPLWNDQVTDVPWLTVVFAGVKLKPDATIVDPPPTAAGAPTRAAVISAAAPRPTGARHDRMRTRSP